MFFRILVVFIALCANAPLAGAKTPNWPSPDGARLNTPSRAVTFGKATAMPIGFYELCRVKRHPVCRETAGRLPVTSSGAVRLDAALAARLVAINAGTNRAIQPRQDPRWRVAPVQGDCKDYALTKRYRLMNEGWPTSALLLAIAWTRTGSEHAVLIVRTDVGDVVLDNLSGTIRPWSWSLYRWISVQAPGNGMSWRQVGGDRTVQPAAMTQ